MARTAHRKSDFHLASERRKTERYRCGYHATCQPISLTCGDPCPAEVRDLSKGGIGILAAQPFRPGSFLRLELGKGSPIVGYEMRVKVIHSSRQPGAIWLNGCVIVEAAPTTPC
jgi:hypothetical protein